MVTKEAWRVRGHHGNAVRGQAFLDNAGRPGGDRDRCFGCSQGPARAGPPLPASLASLHWRLDLLKCGLSLEIGEQWQLIPIWALALVLIASWRDSTTESTTTLYNHHGLTPTNPSKQQLSASPRRAAAPGRTGRPPGRHRAATHEPQSPPEPGAHDRSRCRATSASFTAFITSTYRSTHIPTHICSERSRRLPPLLFAAHFAKHFSVIFVMRSRCACACTSLRSCCSAAACCSAADICDSDSGYWRFAGVNSLLAIARDEHVVLSSECLCSTTSTACKASVSQTLAAHLAVISYALLRGRSPSSSTHSSGRSRHRPALHRCGPS